PAVPVPAGRPGPRPEPGSGPGGDGWAAAGAGGRGGGGAGRGGARVKAAAGGLARIAGARIDDVALARLLKRGPAQARCWLGFTTSVHSRRPYPELGGLWDMVARSAYTQLRYSPVLLAGTVAGLCW